MRKLFVLLLVPALLLAACSDDDGDAPDGLPTATVAPDRTITTQPTIPALAPEEIDDSTPYCAVWKEIRSQGGPQTKGLSTEAAAARRKEYYGRLVPIATRLLDVAPAEIREEVVRALDNARDAATTGSRDSFSTDASQAGARILAQYALDHCRKKG